MLELVLGLLLASGAVAFVLRPIFRPSADDAPSHSDEDAGGDPDDDLSPRAVALRALKEIEFDKATGKLSDADYDGLKVKYTAEALAALRGETGAPVAAPPTAHHAPCPEHGLRPESAAEFCSVCGRRLAAVPAPGYCGRCGGALESDARFCGRCGVPVAA